MMRTSRISSFYLQGHQILQRDVPGNPLLKLQFCIQILHLQPFQIDIFHHTNPELVREETKSSKHWSMCQNQRDQMSN
jgi:hypothetical protein